MSTATLACGLDNRSILSCCVQAPRAFYSTSATDDAALLLRQPPDPISLPPGPECRNATVTIGPLIVTWRWHARCGFGPSVGTQAPIAVSVIFSVQASDPLSRQFEWQDFEGIMATSPRAGVFPNPTTGSPVSPATTGLDQEARVIVYNLLGLKDPGWKDFVGQSSSQ